MLWIKALHIIFMVTWFAGLFYLPRLYVYHAMTDDTTLQSQYKLMERRLFFGIMTPGGVLTVLFGLWLWWGDGISGLWLYIKLLIVLGLIVYHVMCGKYLFDFKHDRDTHTHTFYRWFNEIPTVLLFVIIILAIVKPL
jgi:putative membrane protein